MNAAAKVDGALQLVQIITPPPPPGNETIGVHTVHTVQLPTVCEY